MTKNFQETELGYKIILTMPAGGRVMGTLWESTTILDKEFNLVSYERRTNSTRDTTPDTKEIKQAITYAKGQVKKLSKKITNVTVLVRDVYGAGVCIKTLDLTATGKPSLRQAGSRVNRSDIKDITPKIKKEMEATKQLKQKVSQLQSELNNAKRILSNELDKIWNEN